MADDGFFMPQAAWYHTGSLKQFYQVLKKYDQGWHQLTRTNLRYLPGLTPWYALKAAEKLL